MSQPVLLELEAPIKICGDIHGHCYDYSSMANFLQKATICSWVTMWTEASRVWRRYACCWHTKSSTQRTSSFFAGITSVLLSTASMASMMNASVGTIFDSGKLSPTASTACLSPQLLMRKSFAYTADCRPTLSTWKKCGASRVQQTYQIKVCSAICCGQIQKNKYLGGETTTGVSHSHLVTMW